MHFDQINMQTWLALDITLKYLTSLTDHKRLYGNFYTIYMHLYFFSCIHFHI